MLCPTCNADGGKAEKSGCTRSGRQSEESERSRKELERQCVGWEWPRTEKEKQFEVFEGPRTEQERQFEGLERPQTEKERQFEVSDGE